MSLSLNWLQDSCNCNYSFYKVITHKFVFLVWCHFLLYCLLLMSWLSCFFLMCPQARYVYS
jgi:hypothetical protein